MLVWSPMLRFVLVVDWFQLVLEELFETLYWIDGRSHQRPQMTSSVCNVTPVNEQFTSRSSGPGDGAVDSRYSVLSVWGSTILGSLNWFMIYFDFGSGPCRVDLVRLRFSWFRCDLFGAVHLWIRHIFHWLDFDLLLVFFSVLIGSNFYFFSQNWFWWIWSESC